VDGLTGLIGFLAVDFAALGAIAIGSKPRHPGAAALCAALALAFVGLLVAIR
jgi:UDP-N-acetylmuramyl pentapeptide phosphotransferase/UDP-N-acetylglucosamine-1-phosphate transferase